MPRGASRNLTKDEMQFLSYEKNEKKCSLCEKTAKITRYSEKNVYLCGVNLRIE